MHVIGTEPPGRTIGQLRVERVVRRNGALKTRARGSRIAQAIVQLIGRPVELADLLGRNLAACEHQIEPLHHQLVVLGLRADAVEDAARGMAVVGGLDRSDQAGSGRGRGGIIRRLAADVFVDRSVGGNEALGIIGLRRLFLLLRLRRGFERDAGENGAGGERECQRQGRASLRGGTEFHKVNSQR